MRKTTKQFGFFVLLVVMIIGFSGCDRTLKYVEGDIDDIVYAEPTEEAKNFDIEGYINSLPQVEYTKIDYPVKATYEYSFNDYFMTIDIPDGLDIHEISTEPRVHDSKDLADSYGEFGQTYGPGVGDWTLSTTISEDSMVCIHYADKEPMVTAKAKTEKMCSGILIKPNKSAYKGVSYRDILMNTVHEYTVKQKTNNHVFLTASSCDHWSGKEIISSGILLDNNQMFEMWLRFPKEEDEHSYDGCPKIPKTKFNNHLLIDSPIEDKKIFVEDIYFSIIDSIKIQKKNEIL